MKTLTLNITSSFEKTHELSTYGSDGSKHRIGAFGGDSCYILNNIAILPFEKVVSRNQYSGRVQRTFRYHKEDIEMVNHKIKCFFKNYIEENKLTTGKNFTTFETKLIEIFKNRNFDEINTLPKDKVFNRTLIEINSIV